MKFSSKTSPKMKRRMQPMQIAAKFFFSLLSLLCFSLMFHAMYIEFHHFISMSMLSFIEDNKRNEHGGSFLENLKFFKIFAFLHLVLYA